MKIIDIETTGLNANNSKLIVFGVKKINGDFKFYKEWEIGEREIIKQVVKELENAKVIIGYNIERFDLPFIVERARALGLSREAEKLEELFMNKEILDVYKQVSYGSLQFWARKLRVSLKLPNVNGAIVPILYAKKNFEKIVMHNYDDLIACEEVFKRVNKL